MKRLKQDLIMKAMMKLLYPVVKLLIRNGISYGQFSEWIKWVFVEVADKEFPLEKKKQSNSRISVLTGLNRKEVQRIKNDSLPDNEKTEKKYNRSTRIITAWCRDPNYKDKKGHVKNLELEGGNFSFSSLVNEFSGDMPVKAVLDELERTGAIQILKNGKIQLVSEGFIAKDDNDKLNIMGDDVAALIETIDHNIEKGEVDPRFQKKVSYINFPEEDIPLVHQLANKKSYELLVELDRLMSSEKFKDKKNSKLKKVGLGIYFFVQDQKEVGERNESK